MKVSAVIVSRNDDYGGNLKERSSYCFQSSIDTYDEVTYIDWNSPEEDGSLFYAVKDNLKFKLEVQFRSERALSQFNLRRAAS